MPGAVPLLTLRRLLHRTLLVTYLLVNHCGQQRCSARQLAAQNTTRNAASRAQKRFHTYDDTDRAPSRATTSWVNQSGAWGLALHSKATALLGCKMPFYLEDKVHVSRAALQIGCSTRSSLMWSTDRPPPVEKPQHCAASRSRPTTAPSAATREQAAQHRAQQTAWTGPVLRATAATAPSPDSSGAGAATTFAHRSRTGGSPQRRD